MDGGRPSVSAPSPDVSSAAAVNDTIIRAAENINGISQETASTDTMYITKKNRLNTVRNTGETAGPVLYAQNVPLQGSSSTNIMPRAVGNINVKIKNGAALDGDGSGNIKSRKPTGVSSAATIYNSIPQNSKNINLSMKK